MVIISKEMIIALPVVITLALIAAFTIVDIALSTEGPPIVNVRKELVCEDEVLIDVDDDSEYNTCFWLISGTVHIGSNTKPYIEIEPAYKIVFNDTINGVIYFAAYVPYTTSAVVIITSIGQAVINLGS